MKRIVLLFSALVVGFVVQAKTVAWWHMDGTQGASAATIENAVDPGTLSGTWSGAATSYGKTFTVPTKGLSENTSSVRLGDASSNMHSQRYAVTDDGSLRLTSLTAEAFVKWDTARTLGANASAGILGYVRDGTVSCAYGVGFYSDAIAARFNDGAEKTITMSAKPDLQTEKQVLDGLWHHVAITFDGETRTAALWVDYVKVGEQVLDGPLNYPTSTSFHIGNYGSRGMLGWVDEVRISDCVLDVGEFLDARVPDRFFLDEHEPADTLYRYRMGDAVAVPPELQGADECNWCKGLSDFDRLNCANWRTGKLQNYSTSLTPPSVVGEPAAARLRFAAGETDDFADAKSVSFAGTGPYAIELPSVGAICGADFTAELFARGRTGQSNCGLIRQLRGGSTDLLWQIGLDSQAQIVFSSWNPTGNRQENVPFYAAFEDGRWHHLAVTYCAETKHVEMFFDGRKVNSVTLGYGLVDAATDVKTLIFGRRADGFDGEIDEVRVTGRRMDPSEFLSFPNGHEQRPLIHFGFDGDWANDPRSVVGVDDATHEAHAGGSDPTIADGQLAGKYLYAGESRTAESFWSTNTHFVSINKGKVTLFSSASPFFSSTRSTTEAFVRFPASTVENYSDVLTCILPAQQSTKVWLIRMNGNKPYVLIDAPNHIIQSKDDAKTLNDGKWHHLALTLEQNEAATETAVVLYVDGVPAAEGTVAAALPAAIGTQSYVLQAGTANGDHYPILELDEVRMTQGILDPSEFLQFGRHFQPSGLMLLFR